MERDIFIISVYCLVADIMQIIEKSYKIRSHGFTPKLSDTQVITMKICGEFFKLHEVFINMQNGNKALQLSLLDQVI